jgi:hypothetical protein
MMQGSDWPAPTAPRTEASRAQVLRAASPAIVVSLALHALLAWWLLQPAEPWVRDPAGSRTDAEAMQVVFFEPEPPPPPADESTVPTARADQIPFPKPAPTRVIAAEEARTAPAATPAAADSVPVVSAEKLFGDIGATAAQLTGPARPSSRPPPLQLPGRAEPIIDAGIVFKPPPPTPEEIVNGIGRMLLSTTAANPTTGLMGTVPGRDPGREIQAAHHADLYLPRGCDDPENPNLSDACLGIPKR